MSLTVSYTVSCDAPGEQGTDHAAGCAEWVAEERTGAMARQEARRRGWRRVPARMAESHRVGTANVDLSPQCLAAR